MVADQEEMHQHQGLVVGNYCHDVIFRDDRIVGESLGGAASFVSNVLDPLNLPCSYVSKVGTDFSYSSIVTHTPLYSSSSSKTSLFHAYFFSDQDGEDRLLKRIHACDPISPSDLPPHPSSLYDFGLAVGVAGEISPETLACMLDLCRVVFVDVQALIRTFDPVDGTVKLVSLSDSGFSHLLPRIGFLKASSEEALFVDIEELRRWCVLIVTDGQDGCRVYGKERELQIPSFPAVQIDPTGAGDSFLGGFVAGLVRGLDVQDAALLGNFFGSLTVRQIGVPKFDTVMLKKVKEELERRAMQCIDLGGKKEVAANKSVHLGMYDEEFQTFLSGVAKLQSTNHDYPNGILELKNSLQQMEQVGHQQNSDKQNPTAGSFCGIIQDIDDHRSKNL